MSDNSQPQDMSSAEYRKLKKRKRERQALKLRMKLAFALIIAAVIAVVVLILWKNDVFYHKAKVSTLTVKEDGSIVLEEVVSLKDIDTDEKDLKASLKKSIEDFQSSDSVQAKNKVGLAAVHVRDDTAYVRTTYGNADTYASYSGYECYVGSVSGAKAAGYAFSDPLCPVTGTERGEAVAADTLEGAEGQQVVIVNEDINIRVPGEISYVTSNVTALTDTNETAASGTATYGTSVAPDTYILYTAK